MRRKQFVELRIRTIIKKIAETWPFYAFFILFHSFFFSFSAFILPFFWNANPCLLGKHQFPLRMPPDRFNSFLFVFSLTLIFQVSFFLFFFSSSSSLLFSFPPSLLLFLLFLSSFIFQSATMSLSARAIRRRMRNIKINVNKEDLFDTQESWRIPEALCCLWWENSLHWFLWKCFHQFEEKETKCPNCSTWRYERDEGDQGKKKMRSFFFGTPHWAGPDWTLSK